MVYGMTDQHFGVQILGCFARRLQCSKGFVFELAGYFKDVSRLHVHSQSTRLEGHLAAA